MKVKDYMITYGLNTEGRTFLKQEYRLLARSCTQLVGPADGLTGIHATN